MALAASNTNQGCDGIRTENNGQRGSRDHRDGVLPGPGGHRIRGPPWSRAPSAVLGKFDFILAFLFSFSSLPSYILNLSSLIIPDGFALIAFLNLTLLFETYKMSAPAAFSDIAKASNDVCFSLVNLA